jgi:hypothetical protein
VLERLRRGVFFYCAPRVTATLSLRVFATVTPVGSSLYLYVDVNANLGKRLLQAGSPRLIRSGAVSTLARGTLE